MLQMMTSLAVHVERRVSVQRLNNDALVLMCMDVKLTFSTAQGLEDSFVSQSELSTLHHQGEPVVDALLGLLL